MTRLLPIDNCLECTQSYFDDDDFENDTLYCGIKGRGIAKYSDTGADIPDWCPLEKPDAD